MFLLRSKLRQLAKLSENFSFIDIFLSSQPNFHRCSFSDLSLTAKEKQAQLKTYGAAIRSNTPSLLSFSERNNVGQANN